MATGIGNLPYLMPPVSPFDVITSQAENERIANIESLADGTGIGDSAITNAKLSTTAGELGGAWQSWTPTKVGWSSYTREDHYWTKIGKTVILRVAVSGTSNNTRATITLPTNAKDVYFEGSSGLIQNNGAIDIAPARVFLDSVSTLEITRLGGSQSWTNSGNKTVRFTFIYEEA